VRVCVTGGTGFLGAHVVRELVEAGHEVRVTYRDERRLARLRDIEHEACSADLFDRAALRRAFRGCELLFHVAGLVGSRPPERVWQINALGPRRAVEAAAAEGVRRVIVTSSVAGLGPVEPDRVGTEKDPFRGWGMGLVYPDSKHEGELEALAAAARLGTEVVITNPSYVLGVPVDRTQPVETSTRVIGNYLRGRLPAVVDGRSDYCDVRDVARGHLRAAERGRPGERYVLGGHDSGWVALIDRVAELSGVHHPVAVLPPTLGPLARHAEALRLPTPIASEGIALMGLNWSYSSRKARSELGYRPRALDATLRDTIDWYRELEAAGSLGGGLSPLSVGAAGVRLAGRLGMTGLARVASRRAGRSLVAGG
jgi:dihydroflavonol-4-reductase